MHVKNTLTSQAPLKTITKQQQKTPLNRDVDNDNDVTLFFNSLRCYL